MEDLLYDIFADSQLVTIITTREVGFDLAYLHNETAYLVAAVGGPPLLQDSLQRQLDHVEYNSPPKVVPVLKTIKEA